MHYGPIALLRHVSALCRQIELLPNELFGIPAITIGATFYHVQALPIH